MFRWREDAKALLENVRRWTVGNAAPRAAHAPARVALTPPEDEQSGAFSLLRAAVEDIDAVLRHDPAARHALEVLLVYPGLHALWSHRVAHEMWNRGLVLAPRLLAHASRRATGVEIHPGARIGRRVFIDHGMGIVIGETATVGDECLLFKGVVLGGTSVERAERHPTLGRGVIVGTNACVLGAIQIGDGARVGSGSVVIRDVPAGATVVGVPGRTTERKLNPACVELNHADLPDPVANVMKQLIADIERLKAEVHELRGGRESEHALAGRQSEHDAFSNDPERDGC